MGIQRDQKLARRVGSGKPEAGAQKPKAAVMVYFGDGASSEGDVHESMVFASSYNAPVVVLLPEQPLGHLRAHHRADPHPALNRAKGYGFPGIRVDGNDVIAVHAVTEWALERARQGKEPGPDRGLHPTASARTPLRTTPRSTRLRGGGAVAGERPAGAAREVPPCRRLPTTPSSNRSRPTATSSPPMSARPRTTWKPRTSARRSPTPYAEAHPLVAEELGVVRGIQRRLCRRGGAGRRGGGNR